MNARPDITYDRIEVGACYADREREVSASLIRAYAEAIESDNGRYQSAGTGKPGQIAPPSLLAMWTPPRVSFTEWTVPPGGIHTEQQWESLRAVRAGEVLRQRIVAREKYIRDGKNYVVYESTFESRDGELVARGIMSLIWPK